MIKSEIMNKRIVVGTINKLRVSNTNNQEITKHSVTMSIEDYEKTYGKSKSRLTLIDKILLFIAILSMPLNIYVLFFRK